MTFINKNNVLVAENLNVISFRDSETSEKRLIIIQSTNNVSNIKSTQNTQENVIKQSFLEVSIFHAILQ